MPSIALRITALVLVSLFALSTAPVQAKPLLGRTVLVGGDDTRRALYQSWIDASAGRVPQAAVTVTLIEAPCPEEENGPPCVAIPDARHWLLYFDAGWADEVNTAGRFAEMMMLHEIGHVYDFGFPADRHRTAFLRIFGYEGWLDPLNQTWEKFATGYAYCGAGLGYKAYQRELPGDATHASKDSSEQGGFWGYGYDESQGDYNKVCRMLRARA